VALVGRSGTRRATRVRPELRVRNVVWRRPGVSSRAAAQSHRLTGAGGLLVTNRKHERRLSHIKLTEAGIALAESLLPQSDAENPK